MSDVLKDEWIISLRATADSLHKIADKLEKTAEPDFDENEPHPDILIKEGAVPDN